MAGPFVISRNGAVIGSPPQQVFDYLADMTRHGEWNPEDGFRVTAQPMGSPASVRFSAGSEPASPRGRWLSAPAPARPAASP